MLHKQFGKNQRLMTGSYQVPIDVYTADIDGDGLDEVLVAGTQLGSLWQPNETILDNDGAILWRRWLPHVDISNQAGWLNSASLIPVNPDHDNHIDVLGWNHGYEITFRFWNGSELVDRPGWPKNFYPLLPTPPVVGDVDGDGVEEIVIGTYDPTGAIADGQLLIYALDGTPKQVILFRAELSKSLRSRMWKVLGAWMSFIVLLAARSSSKISARPAPTWFPGQRIAATCDATATMACRFTRLAPPWLTVASPPLTALALAGPTAPPRNPIASIAPTRPTALSSKSPP